MQPVNNITVLRFIAIVLITNSHLNHLYPDAVSQLATGGAIGNSLFFMLSGYGLALSNQSNSKFLPWYKRRVIRIYPSLIIVTIYFYIIRHSWKEWNALDYIQGFIYPTHYWFISALMIFYVIFFLILKKYNRKYFLAGIFVLTIPYIFFYFTIIDLSKYSIEGHGYFKWIFYLSMMFSGGYMASSRIKFIKTSFIKNSLALLVCIIFYYGIIILVDHHIGAQFQALTHLLMFLIIILFLRVSYSNTINILANTKYISIVINIIAGLTLEIYLLQGAVYSIPQLKNILFPFNLLMFSVLLVILSFILNRVSSFITEKLIHA